MLSGIASGVVHSPTVEPLEHVRVSLATPGTEACDAVGGALRPEWREWPATESYASLVPKACLPIPPSFVLLPNCPSSEHNLIGCLHSPVRRR
jgi:hypothetical protein